MPKTRKRIATKTLTDEISTLPMNKKLTLARALLIKPNETSRTLDSYLNKEIKRRWDLAIEMSNYAVKDVFFFVVNNVGDDPKFQELNMLLPYDRLEFIDQRLLTLIDVYRYIKRKKSIRVSNLEDLFKIYLKLKLGDAPDSIKDDLRYMLVMSPNEGDLEKRLLDHLLSENMDVILTMVNNATSKREEYNEKNYSSPDFVVKDASSSSSHSGSKYLNTFFQELLGYPSDPKNVELYDKVIKFMHNSIFPFERFKTMRNVLSTLSSMRNHGLADRFSQVVFLDILEGRLRVKYLVCKKQNVKKSIEEYERCFTKLLSLSSNDDDHSPWDKHGYIDIMLKNYDGQYKDLLRSIKDDLQNIHNKNVQHIIEVDSLYTSFINVRNNIDKFLRVRFGDLGQDGDLKRSTLGVRKYLNGIQSIINSNCGLLILFYAYLFGL